jgi:FtsH-binding integral membrane protein
MNPQMDNIEPCNQAPLKTDNIEPCNQTPLETEQEDEAFKLNHSLLRQGFVKKVYSILGMQLIFTTLFVACCCQNAIGYKQFITDYKWLYGLAIIINITTLYALGCFKSVSKTVPMNYILLALFTISEAFFVSLAVIKVPTKELLLVLIITTTVVVALSIYAFTTKSDFTMCGGLLFILLLLLIVGTIMNLAFNCEAFEVGLSILGGVLAGVYLIYDTQLVVGRHSLAFSYDDYIQGALQLYIDIIWLFLELLRLFSK